MTRLLTTGYETGDINEAGASTISGLTQMTAATTAPAPRGGGAYCLKMLNTGTTQTTIYKTFALPASKTDVWVRWGVYISGSSTNNLTLAGAYDSGGVAQTCVTWDPATQFLSARQGVAVGGTLLAASSVALTPAGWHVLEWRVQITSATSGTVEVWLDNARVINFTGDNTATATANVQSIALGSVTGSGGPGGLYVALDDIAINDTAGTINNGRPGDGRVLLLSPNGAGSSTQLARGGTDTGANYTQVNEVPPSLTQYVGSATVGQRDLYAVQDLGSAVQSINVVEVIALAQNSDAGGGNLAPTLKSGATTNEATAVALATSANYVTGRWETDPNTGAAWTLAGVNALEAGATVR